MEVSHLLLVDNTNSFVCEQEESRVTKLGF